MKRGAILGFVYLLSCAFCPSLTSSLSFVPSEHFGGTTPYQKLAPHPLPVDLPATCSIAQVHFHARHGSRNPTAGTFQSLATLGNELLSQLPNLTISAGSPFEFLRTWSLLFDPSQVEMLSAKGRQEMLQLGFDTINAYPSLFSSERTFVWNANSQQRVVDSALNFAIGAFGANYTQNVTFNILPETSASGPGSLFGFDTCPNYNQTLLSGQQRAWESIYLPPIVDRFNSLITGFKWNTSTVSMAQTMCQYETAVSAPEFQSPWCTLFTPSEQVNFEWDNDINYLQYAYTSPNAVALGGTYVQLVAEQLRKGSNTQGMFATFSHDNSIMPIITALGMYRHDNFTSPTLVPTSHNPYAREFKSGKTVNFAGNFAVELFTCSQAQFVRLQNNQAVYPLEDCGPGPSGGPDGMCELNAWLDSAAVRDSVKHGVVNGAKLCGNGTINPTHVDISHF